MQTNESSVEVILLVLEERFNKERQETVTKVHSVLTWPYEQAMERAIEFIWKTPEKRAVGWSFYYRVGVYSLAGGLILSYGSPPMDVRFGAG